jgi:hypothetical protein
MLHRNTSSRSRRFSLGSAGVLALASGLALALASPAGPARMSLASPAAPQVVVERYTPSVLDLGGRRYVMVQGMLINRGPGPAQDIHVSLVARRSPGGEILGEGGGMSWLDVLNGGESGPFSVAVPHCCPEDIGAYDFTVTVQPAPADRYLDLAVTGMVEREVNGGRWIYGDLVNTGDAFLNATATDVYMGFWDGEDLVKLDTARMPILHSLEGPTGQSHPPGWRYPWAMQVPTVKFDRTEVWTYAERYPPDVYPVPLGAQGVVAARDGADIRVTATVTSCGTERVGGLLIMVVARDAEDRVVEFGLAQPALASPLAPGDRRPVSLVWPNIRAEIDPAGVTLWPLALDTQGERPGAIPCLPLMPANFLPMAGVGWERP